MFELFYICQELLKIYEQMQADVQGVLTQTVIFHFALAGRNMQDSFGLKVIWEY